jgi:hypothetical protein
MGKEEQDRKALAKLMETPEEKRQRRLEKKAKKEAKRKREGEGEDDLMGYTNDSNPFGDSNLTEKFVWKLKQEKEEKKGTVKDPKQDQKRKEEIRKEIEKVKKRREERELEKAQWEEEKARLQREQDAQSFQDWESKEDEFYLKQAKMAAEIRIQQGRAKPIDILYKNLSMDKDFDFEVNEPYQIFKGLGLAELEELKNDIRVYLELDTHREFWSSLAIVCDDELDAAKKRDALEKSKSKAEMMRFGGNTGIHEAVDSDVHDIFKGKSSKELDTLQESISQQIESGAAIDVEYWESLLKKLTVFKAKAKLKEIHTDMLRRKLTELEAMKHELGAGTTTSTSSDKAEPPHKKEPESAPEPEKKVEPSKAAPAKKAEPTKAESTKKPEKSEWEDEDEKPAKKRIVEQDGRFSPELVHSVHAGEEVVDFGRDMESLGAHRRQVLQLEAKKLLLRMDGRDRKEGRLLTEDEMYKQEAAVAMEEEEEEFTGDVELPVDNKVYSLHDKFRPRKPRFFNRVHTGYEWNKYNQTHYDHDNPPPKVVQGYKFNIFYPDLLDKTHTPTYKVLNGQTADTCTLLIHAGPPYEDIAFKIVNREWEYSHKKGFKCTYERGILHLWFNFKRYRYRR